MRRLLGLLLERSVSTIAEIVSVSGSPRRDVEHLIRTMGSDARLTGDRIEIRAPEAYSGLALGAATARDWPLEEMRSALSAAPESIKHLDHVAATPDTLLRRAAWLDEHYELSQSRILMLGDHDATTLAFDLLGIEVGALSVVDIDQATLAFIDERSRADCYFADLRLGLPEPLQDKFDLVITDPPYSAEGVSLFAARGAEALEHHEHGRLVVSYGYPPASPALGLKVQAALAKLGVVYEAVLPAFNRYDGAQAVGSRSSQYVLRLTRRSKKAAPAVARRAGAAIYSHGQQAAESARGAPPVWDSIVERLRPVELFELLSRSTVRNEPVAVNLVPFFGRSLVYAALAAQAPVVELLVDNETPGIRSASEQAQTRRLLGEVKFQRSVNGSPFTLVNVAGPSKIVAPFERLEGLGPGFDGRRPLDLPLHRLLALAELRRVGPLGYDDRTRASM
jgi:hypothetical protein